MARFAEQLAAAVRAAPQRDREQALRNFIKSLVKAHRSRRALLRALALRALLGGAPFPQLSVGELAEQIRTPGTDARSAALFVEAAVALLRGHIVFPELWEPGSDDDDELVARLMALGRALLG
jgi:hypothetical protein